MKIEAVTVCRDYGDYLAVTLPLNKHHFDRMVVVTSPQDTETQRLCEYHNVECVVAQCIAEEFAKGAAINAGLAVLSLDGWVVHVDADVVLPPLTRQIIDRAGLDTRMVYGIDRHYVRSFELWHEHQVRPTLQHENDAYVHTEAYPIATRFAHSSFGGYVPIGFFQMWCPRVSGRYRYPESHATAARTDVGFSIQWPRAQRGFIPEVVGYHLESGVAEEGANWSGRTTPRFCRPQPPAVLALEQFRRRRRWSPCRWWRRRRKRRHPYGL